MPGTLDEQRPKAIAFLVWCSIAAGLVVGPAGPVLATPAVDADANCERRRVAAWAIMEARQMGVPRAELETEASEQTGSTRDFSRIMIRQAFDQPIHDDDPAKLEAVDAFSTRMHGLCMQASKGQ